MINIKRLVNVFLVLVIFFLSDSILAQKINQFDANKKRTGVWRKYYPNKTIRYEGQFKNGKEIGVFKFYEKSNSQFPIIIKRYSDYKDTIAVEFYTIKGRLQSKGFFINKTRVGEWQYYFKNNKLMSKEFYHQGKLHGKIVNYYPNGKPTEIVFYKNGLKDGLSKKYSSDGILIEELNYEKDKLNGLAKYYELNGNLKEKGVYKNGKRIGKWEYFMDGEVADDEELKKKKKFTKKKGG
ncbi:toxin-antitoxin system YwqK family antitoxin [Polaribacter porphyrae]|uniref:Preprotein translocase YidC n=1 Tax=Polaribacter porphyrae TaxID=1137780 RepID=A0A2S7WKP4_9FLAO|nr:toxin-antitoxin system YwqK family antitoxin [Polaribacter porphyrae]PQJ78175.1 hypothetical protein BTO18_02755 [Polaribacter porphyrae]